MGTLTDNSVSIHFLGVGSAFTTSDYYQSNLLLTANNGHAMLVDCGSDARFSLRDWSAQQGQPPPLIHAVYISHLHADHIGGMEWLAFNTYFNPNAPKPILFGVKSMLDDLWNKSLRGGLEYIGEKVMELSDYFEVREVKPDLPFEWEGVTFTPIKLLHVNNAKHKVYSYGLIIQGADIDTSYLFTSDTVFDDTLKEILTTWISKVGYIFQEVETVPFRTGVHPHYEDLCTLDPAIRKKMWLYHHSPDPPYAPEKDGFMGFIHKGDRFPIRLTKA
ncbi:MAG: ribonuclease Z [Magnetococcales bacterium]|nr:ribonuclease Z [Magnetococcales bacterium]